MLKRFLLTVLMAIPLALIPTAAFASEGDPIGPARLTEGSVFTIDLGLWTTIQGLIVPLIVGIALKATASSKLKVIVSIVVNAIGGLASSFVVTDAAVISKAVVFAWLVGLLGTIAAHYGVWKPLNVTGTTPETNKLAPNTGAG